MTRRRNDHDRIQRAAKDLADIARLWERYLTAMANYSPGVRSTLGTAGARSTGISDPTGSAVTAAERTDADDNHAGWRTDPLIATHTRILADLARLLPEINRTASTIRSVAEPTARPDRQDPIECHTPTCTTIIETKLSELAHTPYCAPCYRWLLENDATTVPARVIAERTRKRGARADMSATADRA